MAVTYSGGYTTGRAVEEAKKKLEEQEAKQPGKYAQSAAVTNAQNAVQNHLAQQPGAYKQSDAVTKAQQQLQAIEASRPQGYNSKYGTALDNILAQIQNPKDFKYDFNGDELFKQYADQYTQKGRQASMNAMGQAAALTGGYGNSYAQQVGNQAYDQYLLDLYDKGLELRDRAYQQYKDQRADLYNQYGAISNQDNTEYGRYRDTVGDWKDDRNYYTNYMNNERNFDYGQYRDEMADYKNTRDYLTNQYRYENDFGYGQYRDEVSDYMNMLNYYNNNYSNEKNFDYGAFVDNRNYEENVRQFQESLDWDKMSTQQKYAAEWCMQMLAAGQMPSDEQLAAAGLSAEDAAKLMAPAQVIVQGGGGSGGNRTVYIDPNGIAYTTDKKGNPTMIDRNTLTQNDRIIETTKSDKKGVQAFTGSAKNTISDVISQIKKANKKKTKDN